MKFNWGHGIFIFMTVFILLGVAAIIFSLNQSEDLVSDDYYDKGADYSQQIEVNKRSDIYQDSINIDIVNANVEVYVCQSLKASTDTLLMHFYNPSNKNLDIKLKYPMANTISIPISTFKNGRYEVKMSWTHLNNLFNLKKDISIK